MRAPVSTEEDAAVEGILNGARRPLWPRTGVAEVKGIPANRRPRAAQSSQTANVSSSRVRPQRVVADDHLTAHDELFRLTGHGSVFLSLTSPLARQTSLGGKTCAAIKESDSPTLLSLVKEPPSPSPTQRQRQRRQRPLPRRSPKPPSHLRPLPRDRRRSLALGPVALYRRVV